MTDTTQEIARDRTIGSGGTARDVARAYTDIVRLSDKGRRELVSDAVSIVEEVPV